MQALQYQEILRSVGGHALLSLHKCFTEAKDVCGEPLPYRKAPAQVNQVHKAMDVIRGALIDLALEPNTAPDAARRRQGTRRGKPASAAARTLY